MTSQIASLQSALTAAQSEAAAAKASAEDALKRVSSAESAATEAEKAAAQAALDAANAKTEAIKAAQDEVAKIQAELEAAIDSKFEAAKNEFAKTIAELTKKVEDLTGYTTGMVTGISFAVANNTDAGKEYLDPKLDVNYARVATVTYPDGLATDKNGTPNSTDYSGKKTSNSYEFGKGLTGTFTVKAGDVNTVPDYMLVNVDPVNAAVSSEMLSLINGNGGNLNNYVDMTCGIWEGDIIRTRSAANTGLRWVGVQLKNDVDFEAFDKLVLPGGAHHQTESSAECNHNYIGYALAATDSEGRIVTSPYDVTLHVREEGEAKDIKVYTTIYSAADSRGRIAISNVSNGKDDTGDEQCYAIAAGDPFQIYVAGNGGRVMASYVIVDYDYKELSVADKTALKAMTYAGVNEVRKDGVHNITVSGAAGIPVPLKLVTIDYTGIIKVNMIWVKAGEPARMEVAYTFTPKTHVKTPEAWTVATGEKVAFTIPADAATYSVSLTVGEAAHQDDDHKPVVYAGEKLNVSVAELAATVDNTVNSEFLKLYKADKRSLPSKNSEVAYAEFVGKVNLQMMKENQTYTGTVKFYDKTGTFLGTNTIKVTKVLPTAVPSDFSAKTNGIVNGVLTAYPRPTSEDDKTGVYYMKRAFNNWTPYYDLIINGLTNVNPANAKYQPGDTTNANDKGDNSTARVENINTGCIHNDVAYATTVKYNYGKIQYIPEGHGTTVPGEYTVTWGTSFSTKFNCWPVDCEYQWYETPVVYYRQTNVIKGTITKDKDGKVTAFTNVIKAISPYKGAVDPFDANDKDWTDWAKAFNTDAQNVTITLITNNSGKEVKNEYFTAKFVVVDEGGIKKNAMELTPTGAEVQVGGDVETDVILTITDKFGHPHDIPALKFTMKIKQD